MKQQTITRVQDCQLPNVDCQLAVVDCQFASCPLRIRHLSIAQLVGCQFGLGDVACGLVSFAADQSAIGNRQSPIGNFLD
jgi:hypothetical protein